MISLAAPGLLIAIPLLLLLRALLLPNKRYPPGPPGLLILGNIREILAGNWNETFTKWQKSYGDIVFASVPGRSIYIINSYQLAEETLGKYRPPSGRPHSRMISHLMHWNWNPGFMDPSKEWSQTRLHLRQAIGPQVMPGYRPFIYNGVTQLIRTLIDFEGDPAAKIGVATGTIINKMAYGDEIFKEHGQKILEMNREGADLMVLAGSRFWLVDSFPPLQYIPSWFPGATFQRLAKRSRVVSNFIRHEPWRIVLDRLRRPEGYEDCIMTRLIENVGERGTLRDAIAIMYTAGADTTTSSILVFLLCIMLHPDVQQRVHEELDRVIGLERPPTYEDRTSLTYFQAAWKEASRWHPILPLAVPHVTTDDRTLQGYSIPKGSLIFPNTGFMLRDPQIWDSPELYLPDRFLVPPRKNQPDPSIGFGYGRRVCPGRFFADETGLAVSMTILWAFRIERMEGPASPNEIKWAGSLLSSPPPFKLRFHLRTSKIDELLNTI